MFFKKQILFLLLTASVTSLYSYEFEQYRSQPEPGGQHLVIEKRWVDNQECLFGTVQVNQVPVKSKDIDKAVKFLRMSHFQVEFDWWQESTNEDDANTVSGQMHFWIAKEKLYDLYDLFIAPERADSLQDFNNLWNFLGEEITDFKLQKKLVDGEAFMVCDVTVGPFCLGRTDDYDLVESKLPELEKKLSHMSETFGLIPTYYPKAFLEQPLIKFEVTKLGNMVTLGAQIKATLSSTYIEESNIKVKIVSNTKTGMSVQFGDGPLHAFSS